MNKVIKEVKTLPITQERIDRQLMVQEMLKADGFKYAVFKQSMSGRKMSFAVAYKTQKEAEDQAIKLMADQLSKTDKAAFTVVELKKTYIFDNGFKEI